MTRSRPAAASRRGRHLLEQSAPCRGNTDLVGRVPQRGVEVGRARAARQGSKGKNQLLDVDEVGVTICDIALGL